MAYTIIRSNGTTLTTIPDGNINTSSTSLGLPGRNYPGYGQTLDTNFVRIVENFANTAPPQNPLKGQLWYNTTLNTLNICPADGSTNANNWSVVATTSTGGSATLGNITVTGNVAANNLAISETITCNNISATTGTFSDNIIADIANITTANVGVVRTVAISTSESNLKSTTGTMIGTWTVSGNGTPAGSGSHSGSAMFVTDGNLEVSSSYGIKAENYYYANGSPFNPSGTYTNTNVSDYLTGANSVTQFDGDISPNAVSTTYLYGGGNIGGIWTLEDTARINATYADIAERYEADAEYEIGTVVALGGDKEVTIAPELSDQVFGVVSNTYAYLMNEGAGTDSTHPAIALAGRVKVKVVGKVNKHQRLVSAGNGNARAASDSELTAFNSIGRALEEKLSDDSGIIEAVVVIK